MPSVLRCMKSTVYFQRTVTAFLRTRENMSTMELDEGKRKALEELRRRTSELLQPRHDDRFLLRWLRARDFNVDAAEIMLREDFKFRKRFGSDTITENYVMTPDLTKYISFKFFGFDSEGNGVVFANFGTIDLKGFTRSLSTLEIIRFYLYMCESIRKDIEENNLKTGKCGETASFICDLTGFSASHWFDKHVLRIKIELSKLFQDHYPESLKIAYVINTPSVFYYVYRIVKPFVNETVLKKLRIYGIGDQSWQEEVFSLVGRENIPAYLGGGLYSPDRMCSDIVPWNKTVPTTYYIREKPTLKTTDPDVKGKLVRERSCFEVERYIEKAGTVLHWEFVTKGYSLRFGLFYKEKKPNDLQNVTRIDNDDRQELIPVEATESHEWVEKGEWECADPGTYIFHFDNTNSWLRSKSLLYKIEARRAESC